MCSSCFPGKQNSQYVVNNMTRGTRMSGILLFLFVNLHDCNRIDYNERGGTNFRVSLVLAIFHLLNMSAQFDLNPTF